MRYLSVATILLGIFFFAAPANPSNPSAEPTFIDGDIGFAAIHAISGDGHRVVFESASDLTGGNPDGNGELFLWSDTGGFLQLTDTTGQSFYWEVDVDEDGSAVLVTARADITGVGATLTEIYRWSEGSGWTRLTTTPGASPLVFIGGIGISSNGNRLMFTSRGNYAGVNPTAEEQVFTWDPVAGFAQITNGSPCGSGGGNFGIDLSGSGTRVLLSSRCQYGSSNADLNGDLFLWDESTGISPLTDEAHEVGARGTLNHDGTIAAVTSSTDLANGGFGAARHLFRWVEGLGFAQLSTEGVDNDRASVSADGTRIAYTALNGQGTGGNPENAPEIFLWQLGYPPFELTDSEQSSTSFGNERPDLDDRGTRLSMVALRAFNEPLDNRTGYFTLDLWLFADDFESGDTTAWSSAVP